MSASSAPLAIQMHAGDNVAIIANDGGLPANTVLPSGLVLRDKVPQGHKVALLDIVQGQAILRYNVPVGYAKQDIAAGSWVHERLLDIPAARELQDLPMASVVQPQWEPLQGFTFEGFANADGSVGTRNLLAITTTVQCVAGVVSVAVERIRKELLPHYPNVDGVLGLEHTYGCGVAIDAPGAEIPIRTLRNISLNPNFGGEVMVVSLGCEKLQPDRLLPAGSFPIQDLREPDAALDTVCLQHDSHVGFVSMIDDIVARAKPHLERLNARRRQTVPASALVVGVQCDLLVRAGATIMFSENTEVRDAVEQLTSRAATPAVAQRIIDELGWYDQYLDRGRADRTANTTPGNKAGGLANIAEKAMGSIIKSGSAAISHVLSPGNKLKADQKGLVFAATPASDFICGTLQLAAGMNLHVFTTGRGTPYGLAECPVVKVATRTDLATRWHDLMDMNAGRIADGQITIEEAGWELFHLLLDVASGRKTWAEKWKLHNALVLFNPAPIT